MFYGFKNFHPLKGCPPKALNSHGADIVVRARELLHYRTLKEIQVGMDIVNWMFDEPVLRDESFRRLSELAKSIDTPDTNIKKTSEKNTKLSANKSTAPIEPLSRNDHSSVSDLLFCKTKFDLADYEDFPNATWHELFAVLALGVIEKACADEKYYGSWAHDEPFDWLHEWRIETHVSDWLIEAMDAIATAEGLAMASTSAIQIKENTLAVEKKKRSLKSKTANIQRHAKTNAALLELLELYRQGSFRSMNHAAQIYCERNEQKVEHLLDHNRIRTLREGLSNLLKDKRLSLKK